MMRGGALSGPAAAAGGASAPRAGARGGHSAFPLGREGATAPRSEKKRGLPCGSSLSRPGRAYSPSSRSASTRRTSKWSMSYDTSSFRIPTLSLFVSPGFRKVTVTGRTYLSSITL